MTQAAAARQASKTDFSRRTEPAAGPRGIVLAPLDYGIDFVDQLSSGDGPIQLNSSPRVLQLKTPLDGISNSPRVMQQTALMGQIANSPRVLQQKAFFDSVTNSRRVIAQRQPKRLFGVAPVRRTEMNELPGQPETAPRAIAEATVSRRESFPGSAAPLAAPGPKPNTTGLPDALKSGVESLSGLSLDNVKVHRDSSRPAQLNALAYAQGSDIHLAPGQDQHLPHEAWHVVQQAQGRVQPTMQLKDRVPANDDAGLEHEADVMGAKALQMRNQPDEVQRLTDARQPALQRMTVRARRDEGRVASLPSNRIATVQRRIGRADGVADMSADQLKIWLTSQEQWQGISRAVLGVIERMRRSDHQWTYGGFFSYLLVRDASALVNVGYERGLIHGGLDGVTNIADLHVSEGDGGGLGADMLTVAQDVLERMTAANTIHGAPKGQVYLRPQGAAIIKIVAQLLGEALGDEKLIAQARDAIKWRKLKEKLPFATKPSSRHVLEKSVVPEHSAYMKSLVGVSGVDIRPILKDPSSLQEYNQNMLEASDMGQARLTKYLKTVELATEAVSMQIYISQDRLPAVISLLKKQ